MSNPPPTEPNSPSKSHPTWLLLAGIALGVAIGVSWAIAWTPSIEQQTTQLQASRNEALLSDVTTANVQPQPEWSPADVVQQQMESLTASRTDPLAIRNCFALASPSNRMATGPLERFAAMASGPGYRPLIDARSYLVGDAVMRDHSAAVLVTLITHDGEPFSYRFFLSQQPPVMKGSAPKESSPDISGGTPSTADGPQPNADCWMTDGVVRELPPVQRSPAQPSPSARPNSGSSA
ncbi:DUF4864 domain-containing protein [Adhaeretor mobilis]|uniref:Uncharacterized protein n=1 Tax=Adhaeretor mobilis TaxID=1930276 RepID=A0A517N2F4_9BACT|nr:hypothetical protein [Adhaeretor mobilis]QDT01330.1 hypothetical protein HG15A2_46720 [Adhaeretor mobilis]